jgi:hypothetical protein
MLAAICRRTDSTSGSSGTRQDSASADAVATNVTYEMVTAVAELESREALE